MKCCQVQNTETATESTTLPAAEALVSETTTEPGDTKEDGKDGYVDMEIISIDVLPRVGNAVVLSWGKPLREYHLNWTYGVYYGVNMEDALKGELSCRGGFRKNVNRRFIKPATL